MLSKEQIAQLNEPLDTGRVAHRDQSGKQLSYIEGYDAIDTANQIFGYGEWGYDIISLDISKESSKVFYTAIIRLSVTGCHSVTDVGIGITPTEKPEGHEMAIKGAVTDALKRALRTFGNQFGNSLYDKDSPVTNTQPARPAARPAPAQPTQIGLAEKISCNQCGKMAVLKSGVSKKTDKPYTGWVCPDNHWQWPEKAGA
jgi:DNA repair and recombination protein RAD52